MINTLPFYKTTLAAITKKLLPMNMQQENDMQSNGTNNTDDDRNRSSNTKETEDTSAIYFGDSTMQTKAEFEQNKKADHTKEDDTFAASATEDTESDIARAAGTDRAAAADGETFGGDTELDKGLEAQAKDEEL